MAARVRRAWIMVALTPVGILAGIAVAYAVAALLGITLDPATPAQTRSGLENAACFGSGTFTALICPVGPSSLLVQLSTSTPRRRALAS